MTVGDCLWRCGFEVQFLHTLGKNSFVWLATNREKKFILNNQATFNNSLWTWANREQSSKSANYRASLKNNLANLAGERNNKLAWWFISKPQRKGFLQEQALLSGSRGNRPRKGNTSGKHVPLLISPLKTQHSRPLRKYLIICMNAGKNWGSMKSQAQCSPITLYL